MFCSTPFPGIVRGKIMILCISSSRFSCFTLRNQGSKVQFATHGKWRRILGNGLLYRVHKILIMRAKITGNEDFLAGDELELVYAN